MRKNYEPVPFIISVFMLLIKQIFGGKKARR
jgi:hypothetical protein